jgi:hypothetical protein
MYIRDIMVTAERDWRYIWLLQRLTFTYLSVYRKTLKCRYIALRKNGRSSPLVVHIATCGALRISPEIESPCAPRDSDAVYPHTTISSQLYARRNNVIVYIISIYYRNLWADEASCCECASSIMKVVKPGFVVSSIR